MLSLITDESTFLNFSGIFLVLFISTLDHFKGIGKAEPYYNNNNCSSTDSIIIFHASSERQHDENEMVVDILINETTSDTNVSHFKTSTDWNNWPNLKFPSTNLEKQYKMANLHLEKGIFVFDFLRKFLSFIQPYDIPIGRYFYILCYIRFNIFFFYVKSLFSFIMYLFILYDLKKIL